MKRAAVPLLLIALAVSGCGGSDETTTAATSAAPPTTATTAAATAATTATAHATTPAGPSTDATAPTTAGDRAVAQQGLLRRADLPSNWSEGDDADDDPTDGPCPAIRAAKRAVSARAASNTFASGSNTINSVVYLYATEAEAQRSFAGLSSITTRRCLTREALKPVQAAAKKAKATVGPVRSGVPQVAPVGDESSAFRVAMKVRQDGRTDDVTLSVNYTRIGRGLALLALVGLNDEAQRLIATTAARRLTDALAVGP